MRTREFVFHLITLTIPFRYGLNVFSGMAESNAFLSDRVTEAMRIMKILSHEEAMGKSNMSKSLSTYQRHLLKVDNTPESLSASPFKEVRLPYLYLTSTTDKHF